MAEAILMRGSTFVMQGFSADFRYDKNNQKNLHFLQQNNVRRYLIDAIAKNSTKEVGAMEDTLVKKAQRGDPDSFVRLMELNKNSMQRVAYGFFHEEEDVADVIQDTVLLAYEHIGEVQKTEFFKSWLIRILINNCRKLYNSQKKVKPQEWMEDGEGKRDTYLSDNEFFRMLSLLPSESRVIFQLFYGEQFTTKEISRLLQMNESTIRSKLHRGKEQLRSSWKGDV